MFKHIQVKRFHRVQFGKCFWFCEEGQKKQKLRQDSKKGITAATEAPIVWQC